MYACIPNIKGTCIYIPDLSRTLRNYMGYTGMSQDRMGQIGHVGPGTKGNTTWDFPEYPRDRRDILDLGQMVHVYI